MSDYPYLSELNEAQFDTVMELLSQYGIQGFLILIKEIAHFKAFANSTPPEQRTRAGRVESELISLIERLEGFEELVSGGN